MTSESSESNGHVGTRPASSKRVFLEMLREEWRLHSRLFGGRRFAGFPLLVGGLVVGTAWLLVRTGTRPVAVAGGIHALVFVLGLHTGSVGFVGRDALNDLLGELTLIAFTARTLPLSQRRLLGLFVVKDVVYYAILFVVPLALGTVPGSGIEGAPGLLAGVLRAVLAWGTLTLTFGIGVATTLATLGLVRAGIPGVGVGALAGLGVVAAWQTGIDPLPYTPWGVFVAPGAIPLLTSAAIAGGLFTVAASTFSVRTRSESRTYTPAFRRWSNRIGDPVATRSLLEVHRSAGGLGKVIFSTAVLLGVSIGLVELATRITGVQPSTPLALGTILGLSGFTTYNWLTQGDDIGSYLQQPLSVADVFRGKFRAFLTIGPITALLTYVIGISWVGGALGPTITGAVVLTGVNSYVFGITVALAGLSPNEFLFDTALFGVFGLAMALPLVPLLVIALVVTPLSPLLLAGLACFGGGLGIAGLGFFRRALPRWTRRQRS
ncbi:MAG: hypothetical protein ABEJ35_03960 [Halobacteriaceae archaeon]